MFDVEENRKALTAERKRDIAEIRSYMETGSFPVVQLGAIMMHADHNSESTRILMDIVLDAFLDGKDYIKINPELVGFVLDTIPDEVTGSNCGAGMWKTPAYGGA